MVQEKACGKSFSTFLGGTKFIGWGGGGLFGVFVGYPLCELDTIICWIGFLQYFYDTYYIKIFWWCLWGNF